MERRILFVLTSSVALISYVALAQEKLSYPDGYKGPVANYGVEETKAVPKGTPVAGNRPTGRRPLFFKVAWTPVAGLPEEHNLDARAIADNPGLELHLWGPSGKEIQENGTPGPDEARPGNPPGSNPMHLWTGLCQQVCGMSLREKDNYVDLSGTGKIRWLSKAGGFHQVHPIVKLADGSWFIGERGSGEVFDYTISEFTLSEMRWMMLDPVTLTPHGRLIDKVDLSKVDEIGWTDLMPGSGHGDGGYTDMGWIEVYGNKIPRK